MPLPINPPLSLLEVYNFAVAEGGYTGPRSLLTLASAGWTNLPNPSGAPVDSVLFYLGANIEDPVGVLLPITLTFSKDELIPVITLNWLDNNLPQDVLRYELRKRFISGSNTEVLLYSGLATSFTDTNLQYETSYQYRITVIGSAGQDPVEDLKTVTIIDKIPAPVAQNIQIGNDSYLQIQFQGDFQENFSNQYEVYRNLNGGAFQFISTQSKSLGPVLLAIEDLNPEANAGSTVGYQLKARNNTSPIPDSDFSNTVSITLDAKPLIVEKDVFGDRDTEILVSIAQPMSAFNVFHEDVLRTLERKTVPPNTSEFYVNAVSVSSSTTEFVAKQETEISDPAGNEITNVDDSRAYSKGIYGYDPVSQTSVQRVILSLLENDSGGITSNIKLAIYNPLGLGLNPGGIPGGVPASQYITSLGTNVKDYDILPYRSKALTNPSVTNYVCVGVYISFNNQVVLFSIDGSTALFSGSYFRNEKLTSVNEPSIFNAALNNVQMHWYPDGTQEYGYVTVNVSTNSGQGKFVMFLFRYLEQFGTFQTFTPVTIFNGLSYLSPTRDFTSLHIINKDYAIAYGEISKLDGLPSQGFRLISIQNRTASPSRLGEEITTSAFKLGESPKDNVYSYDNYEKGPDTVSTPTVRGSSDNVEGYFVTSEGSGAPVFLQKITLVQEGINIKMQQETQELEDTSPLKQVQFKRSLTLNRWILSYFKNNINLYHQIYRDAIV